MPYKPALLTTAVSAILLTLSVTFATPASAIPHAQDGSPQTSATPSACDGWSDQALLPNPVEHNAVVSLGNYLYSFGGAPGGLDNVGGSVGKDASRPAWGVGYQAYRFDGSNWTQIANMPVGTWYGSTVSDGRYIYIFGGEDQSVNHLYRYDPQTNSYAPLASSPHHTYAQGAAYLDGKIYRIAGITDFAPGGYAYTDSADVYDISANTWMTITNYPQAIGFPMVAAIDGYIYVAGGWDNTTAYTKTYRLDPNTSTWDDTAIADLPTGRYAGAGEVYRGQFIVAGGNLNSNIMTNTVYAWQPGDNTWTQLADMSYFRGMTSGATWGDSFYVVGGVDSTNNVSNTTLRYQSSCPTSTPTPTLTGTPPTATPTYTATPPPPSPTPCAMPFTDLTGNTFSGAIGYLYCHNMVSGVSATSFNPGGSATRAQFARLVVKAFGLQITTPSDGQQLFTDVPPSYYAFPYIETGYIHAILSGYTQAQCQAANALYPCYLPNRAITRAELVKLIVKAGNYPHITPTIPTFVDVPSSYFAYTYIETAYAYHLVHGVDASHFAPAIAIRRDEMAEVVYKAITTP